MYGIFPYIKTIKINHSCRYIYTSPMDPMGYYSSWRPKSPENEARISLSFLGVSPTVPMTVPHPTTWGAFRGGFCGVEQIWEEREFNPGVAVQWKETFENNDL